MAAENCGHIILRFYFYVLRGDNINCTNPSAALHCKRRAATIFCVCYKGQPLFAVDLFTKIYRRTAYAVRLLLYFLYDI